MNETRSFLAAANTAVAKISFPAAQPVERARANEREDDIEGERGERPCDNDVRLAN